MLIYDVENEMCVLNAFQGLSRDEHLGSKLSKIPWTERIGWTVGSSFNYIPFCISAALMTKLDTDKAV